MKTKSIPSRWLSETGRRLDPGPYLSGSIEAKELLKRLPIKNQPLRDLTKGHDGGIYNGPQFSRNYVDSAEHGVPFLGSGSMLLADLSNLPFLRRRDAESAKLRYLKVEEGMTLISCSGTVGRMVFARTNMAGMWSSQDVMKVVPDPEKIPPGYLYAFLSSRFGLPLVTSGTYGAIIQHIEPEHIKDIGIPRLGGKREEEIHDLICRAATLLVAFNQGLKRATAALTSELGIRDLGRESWLSGNNHLGWGQRKLNAESIRALNHDPRCEALYRDLRRRRHDSLGDLCVPKYFKGKIIFRRIDADQDFGWRLVGQREAFRLRPEGRFIATWSVRDLGLRVPPWTVLVPSHGTLGEFELYCRALLVTERTAQYAYSGDFFRCIPKPEKINGAYLFAFLRSETAFRLLRGISTGGKQQEQHPAMMYRLPIPRLEPSNESAIATCVEDAAAAFDLALHLEERAWQLLEEHFRC